MARVKRAVNAVKKRRKIFKLAKGYFGAKSTQYRTAKAAVMKSLKYAYIGRKLKKRDFRKLWIVRINAAARMNGLSYSRLIDGLKKAGTKIEEIVYCPHAPEEDCACRKPKPKLVKNLARKYKVNLKRSFFVGDKIADVKTGKNAGCKTVLIRSRNKISAEDIECEPNLIANNLLQAAEWITG